MPAIFTRKGRPDQNRPHLLDALCMKPSKCTETERGLTRMVGDGGKLSSWAVISKLKAYARLESLGRVWKADRLMATQRLDAVE